MKHFKNWLPLLLLVPAVAVGGSIYTFSNGSILDAAKLNANFSHIHSTMVGGHGARLVNADVSASAAISHSKLATPALVPKAWTAVNGVCAASPCTQNAGSGVSSVTRSGAGVYVLTWSNLRPNLNYAVTATAVGAANVMCYASAIVAASVTLTCITANTAAATDTGFDVVMMDNDD